MLPPPARPPSAPRAPAGQHIREAPGLRAHGRVTCENAAQAKVDDRVVDLEAVGGPVSVPRAPIEQLALAAREGVPGAFDRLVRSLTPRVVGFAGGVLRDRGLAEEAAQETFVRLYRFLPTYRSENFIAWCFAITHNVCRDLLRREQRAARSARIEPDRTPDLMEAADVRRAVEDALDRLPQILRTTFLLHQQGLQYRDVAEVLGCPVGTVRSRLHEARRQLRRMLIHVLRLGEETA